jgi:hypothetical protein
MSTPLPLAPLDELSSRSPIQTEANMLEKTFSDLNESKEEEEEVHLNDKRTSREQRRLEEENASLR